MPKFDTGEIDKIMELGGVEGCLAGNFKGLTYLVTLTFRCHWNLQETVTGKSMDSN